MLTKKLDAKKKTQEKRPIYKIAKTITISISFEVMAYRVYQSNQNHIQIV